MPNVFDSSTEEQFRPSPRERKSNEKERRDKEKRRGRHMRSNKSRSEHSSESPRVKGDGSLANPYMLFEDQEKAVGELRPKT